MKVAKSSEYEYLGRKSGYYILRRIQSDDIELVRHVKYVDTGTNLAYMMLPNGSVEPTYHSRKVANPKDIRDGIESITKKVFETNCERERDELLVSILGR